MIFINWIVWKTTDNYVSKVAHTVTLQYKSRVEEFREENF